jgi:hypothetical protein
MLIIVFAQIRSAGRHRAFKMADRSSGPIGISQSDVSTFSLFSQTFSR